MADRGFEKYKTKDGFMSVRLHYTADPSKDPSTPDGAEWFAKAIQGYPGGKASPMWRKEYEIDFGAFSGQLLCYKIMQDFRDKVIVPYEPKAIDNLYGSVDWGRNNPASFHVYAVDEFKSVHSVYEIYVRDTSVPDFCTAIKQSPYYQRLTWISADPSLWNMNQETKEGLRSLENRFRECGMVLKKSKARTDDLPINELLDRWDKLETKQTRFTISPRCPMQIWEFEHLRYRDTSTAQIEQQNKSEQLVDKDNHSWDDFKYFIHTWISPADIREDEKPLPQFSIARIEEEEDKQRQNWRGGFR